jgi:hypothetical protein
VNLAALLAAGVAAVPIPQGPGSLPDFIGHSAQPQPIVAPEPPRHPHMAPNGRSNIHVDAYQSDVNTGFGPLGRGGIDTVSAFKGSECASITFDARGRLVTVCVGLAGPELQLIDPRTLDTLATFALPPRQPGSGNPFTNFSGGGYFYLDDRDRAVIPTTTRHVLVVAERGDGFAQEADIDLSSAVGLTDQVISALPDFDGRIWFASTAGVVGTADPATGALHAIDLHEGIGNSFAVGPDGVYVVTNAALYRLTAGGDGTPQALWRRTYANVGSTKPGQTQPGSGTTPTLMGDRYVAIADNDDPMNVVVARRSDGTALCTEPLFAKGASATDQSLIATDRIVIAENNYGYSSPTATEDGHTTTPGLQRVDVDGGGCRTVWRSGEVAPSAVPKLSLAAGLVYTYTKPARGDGQDAWYLTALDARTGETAFKRLGGEGLGFNNNYAPVTLGPDGAAYLGVPGGIVAWRDREPPPGSAATAGAARPRVALHVACMPRARVRVTVTGAGIARVTFTRARHAVRRDRKRPFTAVLRRARRVGAHAVLRDGRIVRVARRGCARPEPGASPRHRQ